MLATAANDNQPPPAVLVSRHARAIRGAVREYRAMDRRSRGRGEAADRADQDCPGLMGVVQARCTAAALELGQPAAVKLVRDIVAPVLHPDLTASEIVGVLVFGEML